MQEPEAGGNLRKRRDFREGYVDRSEDLLEYAADKLQLLLLRCRDSNGALKTVESATQ
jgi:hypothetical protein